MYLSDFKVLVSTLAVISTIMQFLSGTIVCRQYVITRTTGESSPLPFLCGVLSSGLWFLYGLIKDDNVIILVNTIGITMMLCYSIIFYVYTLRKPAMLKQVFLHIGSLMIMVGYAICETHHELLLSRIGLLACSLTMITVAAPLNKLFYVIKVKNTKCLPFPMILMSFIVSLLWLLYGIIEDDPYQMVPNFIGAVLAASQLSLFLIYPNTLYSPMNLTEDNYEV